MGGDAVVLDRNGRVLAVGQRVRVLRDPARQGEVRRIVPRYAVLTIITDGAKAGKTELMVRAQDVEVVDEGAAS